MEKITGKKTVSSASISVIKASPFSSSSSSSSSKSMDITEALKRANKNFTKTLAAVVALDASFLVLSLLTLVMELFSYIGMAISIVNLLASVRVFFVLGRRQIDDLSPSLGKRVGMHKALAGIPGIGHWAFMNTVYRHAIAPFICITALLLFVFGASLYLLFISLLFWLESKISAVILYDIGIRRNNAIIMASLIGHTKTEEVLFTFESFQRSLFHNK